MCDRRPAARFARPLHSPLVRTLAAACLRRPNSAAAVLVVLSLALAAGLPRLRTEAGYRAFLGAEFSELGASIIDSNGNTVGHARIVTDGRWVCAECGCTEVQETAWIYMNTGKNSGDDAPHDNHYCPDCDDGQAEVRELPDPDEVEAELHDAEGVAGELHIHIATAPPEDE